MTETFAGIAGTGTNAMVALMRFRQRLTSLKVFFCRMNTGSFVRQSSWNPPARAFLETLS